MTDAQGKMTTISLIGGLVVARFGGGGRVSPERVSEKGSEGNSDF